MVLPLRDVGCMMYLFIHSLSCASLSYGIVTSLVAAFKLFFVACGI